MSSQQSQTTTLDLEQPFSEGPKKLQTSKTSDVQNKPSFEYQNRTFPREISKPGFAIMPAVNENYSEQDLPDSHKADPISQADRFAVSRHLATVVDSVQPLGTTEISRHRFSYRERLTLEFPAKMQAVESMYKRVDDNQNKNYFSRLLDCRSLAMFQRNEETGKVRVTSEHCGLRWCPLCAKSRQGRIMNEVSGWFEKVRRPVLLTLTLKHTTAPLKHQVFYLYKDFKKLRNRKLFSKKCDGGIWFFHIKRSKTDGLWHPHLHCLMDSQFIAKSAISSLWTKITKGSHVVHIKTVENPRNSVAHAARYAAEPCDISGMSEADAIEVFFAMHGKRLCGTWGTGRRMDLRKPADPETHLWKNIGTWNEVQSLADSDPTAMAILNAYVLDSELDPCITLIEPEPPPDPVPYEPFKRKFFQNAFNFACY